MSNDSSGIDFDRLVSTFEQLIALPGPSRGEKPVADYLEKELKELGAETWRDRVGEKISGNTGNLMARFKGEADAPAFAMTAHMDTVSIAVNPKFSREGDVIRTDGTTALGADDRSGIAAIMEVVRVLTERGPLPKPIELIFTVCEEEGLQGSSGCDVSRLSAKTGVSLDGGPPEEVIVRGPASRRMQWEITGRPAHAGKHPEQGISAILLAAKAIVAMKQGRIDEHTAANIGMIEGGTATNVVAEHCTIIAEARSVYPERRDMQIFHMSETVANVVDEAFVEVDGKIHRADLKETVLSEYPAMHYENDDPAVQIVVEAARSIGLEPKLLTSAGGSDASNFAAKGIKMPVIGHGMHEIHTVEEYCDLREMEQGARLLLAAYETWAGRE